MAKFDILEQEGMRFVRMTIQDEMVRAEAGALAFMRGPIMMDAPIPSIGGALKAMLSEQAIVRPKYTGTGQVILEPSVGGYHIFECAGEDWILERGAYWCSEGSVDLGLFRERVIPSFWIGDGIIDFRTRVGGEGLVVLNAQGPVEILQLNEERLAVEGRLVIARTHGLSYYVRRPTRTMIGYWISGEELVRVFEGTGKVMMAATPIGTADC
jgi:uncharacterized protein (AIM24 family)